MNESIRNYKNLLKVFAKLRKYAIIKNNDITDWADGVLASEITSDYEFIEISTTQNTHDLITVLEKNSENADLKIVCRAILGILYHLITDKLLEFKEVFRVAYEISYEEKLTDDEQFLLFGFAEFSMYDPKATYAGFRLFKEDFLEFLSIYKEFKLDNYKDWIKINAHMQYDLTLRLESIRKNYPY